LAPTSLPIKSGTSIRELKETREQLLWQKKNDLYEDFDEERKDHTSWHIHRPKKIVSVELAVEKGIPNFGDGGLNSNEFQFCSAI